MPPAVISNKRQSAVRQWQCYYGGRFHGRKWKSLVRCLSVQLGKTKWGNWRIACLMLVVQVLWQNNHHASSLCLKPAIQEPLNVLILNSVSNCKPLCTRSLAVSLPMPVLAPVTITTLPSMRSLLLHTPPFMYCLQ